jgi:hypothetical protein
MIIRSWMTVQFKMGMSQPAMFAKKGVFPAPTKIHLDGSDYTVQNFQIIKLEANARIARTSKLTRPSSMYVSSLKFGPIPTSTLDHLGTFGTQTWPELHHSLHRISSGSS